MDEKDWEGYFRWQDRALRLEQENSELKEIIELYKAMKEGVTKRILQLEMENQELRNCVSELERR